MSAELDSPVRGRPREFEADQVVDALTELFWTKGYEATSMADIVEATGLNKSSLYNAFGSKEEMFATAVNAYVDQRGEMLVAFLADGSRGLDDVLVLLDTLWLEVESGDHRGCLAVNTSTELGPRNAEAVALSGRYREIMADAIGAALTRAADQGEIDPDSVETYRDTLVSLMLGMAVVVRGGAPDDEIRRHLDAARAVVEGWRRV